MTPGPMLFFGVHPLRLQAGGRITLPREWREGLPGCTLRILPAFNRPCLLIMPAASLNDRDAESARSLGLTIHTRSIDARGRVRLPGDLIQTAGLKTRLAAVGVLTGMEIWDPEAFAGCNSSRHGGREIAAEIGF
ncbi:MAG: hypothetical protein U1F77_20140 [Kiritimatiellia bacterium]